MPDTGVPTLTHYAHQDAADVRELLLDIHDDAYQHSQDPFDRRERFAEFVDSWSSKPTWACVVGYEGDDAVGFAYGATFRPGGWWKGSPLPEGYEAPSRSFALSELVVRPAWRKTGVSVRLHDALLEGRDEDRVTLLVDVEHLKVKALYESWGYREIQRQKPFADAPLLAVMVRDLR